MTSIRWSWKLPSRWLCILAIALVAFGSHHWTLSALGRYLVADAPVSQADFVVISGGDSRFDRAAEILSTGRASRILALPGRQRILVKLEILESGLVVAKREMAKRGVSDQAWIIVPGVAQDQWEGARKFNAWMAERPNARVLVLADRFETRRISTIYDTCLIGDVRSRVSLVALPDREYDEHNWWKCKKGILACFNSYLSLGHMRLCGEPDPKTEDWDPDAYEAELNKSLR